MKKLVTLVLFFCSLNVFADWHRGKITMVAIGYDGKTVSIGQEGFDRTNCTCYSSWPNRYCLDRSRESFKDEYALLLSAQARNKSVSIHIDESTCNITALYEQTQ